MESIYIFIFLASLFSIFYFSKKKLNLLCRNLAILLAFISFGLIVSSFYLSIFLFSIFLIYYFNKRSNKRNRNLSILLTVLSLLLFATFDADKVSENKETVTSKETTISSTTTNYTSETTVESEEIISDGKIAVSYVISDQGDQATLAYQKGNKNTKYLLIDSPDATANQPFSEEASKKNKDILQNANTIEVEYDTNNLNTSSSEPAYIWADGVLVQEILLREGLAKISQNATSGKYLSQLQTAQQEAKNAKKGIWSVDGYASDKGYDVAVYNAYQESEKQRVAEEKRIAEEAAAAQAQQQAAAVAAQQQAAEEAARAQQEADAAPQSRTVFIAPDSGTRYHYSSTCRGLKRANSIAEMTEADAQAQGYTLCKFEH